MPLYFGIPVDMNEAIRIFGLDISVIEKEIIENKPNFLKNKQEIIYSYDLFQYLDKYFKNHYTDIRIFATDKGQYIIGYVIEEPSDVWNKFINVDEFIILILQLRKKFADEMAALHADLSEVVLEYMEGATNAEKTKNPTPYIISYPY